MVTRDILHLTIDTFLDVVMTGNRYLPRGSNENAPFITTTGNVFADG